MSHNQLVTVEFHGQSLVAVLIDGKPYVAMKPICENIGLQWESQYNRLKRNPVLETSIFMMNMQMPGDDQERKMVCLPLDLLNGWLFGVDVNRVREEIRPRLMQYQKECFGVLYRHFMQPAEPAANSFTVQPGDTLNGSQQAALRGLLEANVKKLPHPQQAGAMVKGWSRLKAHFGVGYRDIPAERFTEAISLMARYVADFEQAESVEQHAIPRIDLLNAEALQAAHDSTRRYFSDYRQAVDEGRRHADMQPIPDEVLTGLLAESLMERRFVLSFDYRFGMTVQPIPKDAMVGGVMQMASAIIHGSIKPSPSELLSMTSACTSILAQRANRQLER